MYGLLSIGQKRRTQCARGSWGVRNWQAHVAGHFVGDDGDCPTPGNRPVRFSSLSGLETRGKEFGDNLLFAVFCTNRHIWSGIPQGTMAIVPQQAIIPQQVIVPVIAPYTRSRTAIPAVP